MILSASYDQTSIEKITNSFVVNKSKKLYAGFVIIGLIKCEYEKFYPAMFAKRFEADYADVFEIDISTAKEYYKEAE